jgi:Integrase core domain/Helix-turn-helix domain
MTNDDRLFGYRLQLFDYAARTSVSEACRLFGVHRSTYYVGRRRVERHGLEVLRPRERRAPRMPNQLSRLVEERIVAFALGHPGYGPRAGSRPSSRGRSGRPARLAQRGLEGVAPPRPLHAPGPAVARRRLPRPYEPPQAPPPEPHIEVDRPGEFVGIDCFKVGRLHGIRGDVWQLTAIDVRSSFGWAELVACRSGHPSAAQTSRLARRVAHDLARAGWRLERVLSDNGSDFKGNFSVEPERLGRQSRVRADRPQTNGHVEALHRTILDECWRPSFARYLQPRLAGLRRDLDDYLAFYNHERAHTGRLTRGAVPADLVHGAHKMEPR